MLQLNYLNITKIKEGNYMNNFFYSKKVVISLIFLFITLSIITLNTVYAQNISGNNIIVESGETLEKTSFLSGNNIRVDGDINGTTFVAGGNVEINGDIDRKSTRLNSSHVAISY